MKTTAESSPSGQACSQLGQPTPTRGTYPREPCVVTLPPQPRASGVPALRPLQGAASPWTSPRDPTTEPHHGTPPRNPAAEPRRRRRVESKQAACPVSPVSPVGRSVQQLRLTHRASTRSLAHTCLYQHAQESTRVMQTEKWGQEAEQRPTSPGCGAPGALVPGSRHRPRDWH